MTYSSAAKEITTKIITDRTAERGFAVNGGAFQQSQSLGNGARCLPRQQDFRPRAEMLVFIKFHQAASNGSSRAGKPFSL